MAENEGQKKGVQVCMLGRFSISVGEEGVSDEQNQTYKLWNLLAYLIYHRRRIVTQREFLEHFWKKGSGAAPANALKTQFFRIRKFLAPLFGDLRPILSFRGGYQWNPDIELLLDIDVFEALLQQAAHQDVGASEREALLQEAQTCYGGVFLPKLSQQSWVAEQAAYYRTLYLDMMREYGALLEARGAYDNMVQAFFHAVAIYPMEEFLHTSIVRGLLLQEKHVQALSHYEFATDLFYKSLGVQPWKELRELYDRIMATEQLFEADLSVIQRDLGESVQKEGAFFCEYGTFREIYRLEARRAVRTGTQTYLLLLTLQNTDGSIPDARLLEKIMEQLRGAVAHSLRSGDVVTRYSSGDVVTRYSSAQYVVMLPASSLVAAEAVASRISAKLWRYRTPRLKLSARVRQLNLEEALPHSDTE